MQEDTPAETRAVSARPSHRSGLHIPACTLCTECCALSDQLADCVKADLAPLQVLKDLQYSACRGCNACHKTGDCIVKDDAISLYDRILAVDCIAVASPIYTMGITAELKGLIDLFLGIISFKLYCSDPFLLI
jgi:hypothetical protein